MIDFSFRLRNLYTKPTCFRRILLEQLHHILHGMIAIATHTVSAIPTTAGNYLIAVLLEVFLSILLKQRVQRKYREVGDMPSVFCQFFLNSLRKALIKQRERKP